MKRIAIIPARSGSKRIINKNIALLGNKPMLFWTIDCALESKLFDRILVSTDSQEYANLSIQRGASAPFLRLSDFDDFSPVSLATTNALIQAKDYFGESYGIVVQLMPNCPLRKTKTIKDFVHYFESSHYPSIISAFEYGWMNPNWAYEKDPKGIPIPLFPERVKARSQDLPKLYCPTGSIWITSEKNLLASKNFYLEGWRLKTMPWEESIDIDDMDDFKMAQLLIEKNNT